MIMACDSVGNSEGLCFPDPEDTPRVLYKSYEAATTALKAMVKKHKAVPILYGEVFPYENTTFESTLAAKGCAFYGYIEKEIDGDVYRIALALVTVGLVA
jgi:hypothetical protein